MIQRLLAIVAVAVTGLLSAPQAEAGHSSLSITYRSGFTSCGCPIYTKRYVRGYDCYRRPIFGYTQLPIRHGSSCRHRAVHRPTYHSQVRSRSSHVYRPRISISSRSYGHSGHARRNVGRHYGRSHGSSCR